MKVKHDFLRFGNFKIRNGSQVRFWEDNWLGNGTLKHQYPGLYCITRRKFITIAEVLSTPQPNISWRRSLIGPKLVAWNELYSRIARVQLDQGEDEFTWGLTKSGKFSVKSLYQALIKINIPNHNKVIWKLKAPLKIKVFLWYLKRGVILTKDNLAKRNWKGSLKCCFCHKNETIRHLLFDCHFARRVWDFIFLAFGISRPSNIHNMFGNWIGGFGNDHKGLALLGAATVCWSIWLGRNGLIFENKISLSPLQVIFTVAQRLRAWAVLQRQDSCNFLVMATQHLTQVAKEFFSREHGWRSSLRIDSH